VVDFYLQRQVPFLLVVTPILSAKVMMDFDAEDGSEEMRNDLEGKSIFLWKKAHFQPVGTLTVGGIATELCQLRDHEGLNLFGCVADGSP
jgi:hypothetical protein